MSDAENSAAVSPSTGTPQGGGGSAVGPGARLKACREEKGLTVEQVASQLNLAPRQIQALENDNYAALPGLVIARGFVRAYAKLLKVEAAPLVAMVAEESTTSIDSREMQRALAESLSESMPPEIKHKPAKSGWIGSILLLVVVALGALAAQQMGWLPALIPLASPPSDRPKAIASQSENVPTAASIAASPANDGAVPPPVVGQEGAKVDEVSQAGSLAAAPVAPTPNNIVLTVREDSWIEIKRADSSVLISRIVKAGAIEAFDISQPASLVVGNAAGVDVVFRGKPLELKPIAKTNVARVELK